LETRFYAKTPSNSGGYPRYINYQKSEETKPWHIRLQRLQEKTQILSHREEKLKNNKKRELVASVLCPGNTQPYSSLTLYTFNECFYGSVQKMEYCNHMRNEANQQYREQFWWGPSLCCRQWHAL
jgi:hypothetical protein